MSKRSQSLMVEAMQSVGGPVQRTERKGKHAKFKQKETQTVDQGGENCTNFRLMWSGNAK